MGPSWSRWGTAEPVYLTYVHFDPVPTEPVCRDIKGDRWVKWTRISGHQQNVIMGGWYPTKITKVKPRLPRPGTVTSRSLSRPLRRIGGVHRSGED